MDGIKFEVSSEPIKISATNFRIFWFVIASNFEGYRVRTALFETTEDAHAFLAQVGFENVNPFNREDFQPMAPVYGSRAYVKEELRAFLKGE